MTKKISRWWAVLLAMFLSAVSPVTNAISRLFNPTTSSDTSSVGAEAALAASALAFTILPPPNGPNGLDGGEGTGPLGGPTEFINGMLVESSSWGLAQSTALSSFTSMGGIGYTPEQYMRVTFAAPSATASLVGGIAVSADGEVHVLDCTAGLPAGVLFVGGFPVTSTGQLCVSLT